jgi:IS5 family transposase
VQYGHKLNLATDKSGLILDVVVEDGNPADAERFLPMLDRQSSAAVRHRGRPPPMAAMPAATSPLPTWSGTPGSIAGLRNFRAGIEASISCFKRTYGGARFKAYIWSAVVAHNLMLFARLKSP